MNIFITTGTQDYLNKIKAKYPEELMITMLNENGALLLHETNGQTFFKVPRSYEVIGTSGQMGDEGYAVYQNIPVTDEGRPLFEFYFKDLPERMKMENEFIAIRVLRPLSSNTYIILTVWENEKAFLTWQSSKGFGSNHHEFIDTNDVDYPQKIFSSASYLTKYHITNGTL
jgi:heme oxygenase (mycobilin-producing)